MSDKVLSFKVIESVAVIKMNNPPVNALTLDFLEEFEVAVGKIEKSTNIRAALIASECTGFFSAGDDVSELGEIDENMIALLPRVHNVLSMFEALRVPTVAAINGHALGGGLELALTCDFRFMGIDSGTIGLPEIRLGMIPAFGGTQRLPSIVGRVKATEMMYKGLMISPEQAKEIGLVNDIFEQEALYEKSFDYALRLSKQAVGAIGRIKQCILNGMYSGPEAGFEVEMEMFRENIISDEVKEGVDAFLTGRKAVFRKE